jgi:hypothetical protein
VAFFTGPPLRQPDEKCHFFGKIFSFGEIFVYLKGKAMRLGPKAAFLHRNKAASDLRSQPPKT